MSPKIESDGGCVERMNDFQQLRAPFQMNGLKKLTIKQTPGYKEPQEGSCFTSFPVSSLTSTMSVTIKCEGEEREKKDD